MILASSDWKGKEKWLELHVAEIPWDKVFCKSVTCEGLEEIN